MTKIVSEVNKYSRYYSNLLEHYNWKWWQKARKWKVNIFPTMSAEPLASINKKLLIADYHECVYEIRNNHSTIIGNQHLYIWFVNQKSLASQIPSIEELAYSAILQKFEFII